MNQLSKENLNLVRLINRLDKNPNFQLRKPAMTDGLPQTTTDEANGDQLGELAKINQHRYWELKALETTIRHARLILNAINSNPSALHSISQVQDPIELKKKLERIRERIDVALKTCPAPTATKLPPSRPSTLIYEIKAPELPSVPNKQLRSSEGHEIESRPERHTEIETKDKLETDEKPVNSEFTPSVPAQQPSNLNANQEELTEELSQMASQLKKNVHHFNKLLADDQAILLANQTKLELNSDTMTKEGGRLTQVSLKNRSMTWFTIAAVCAVAVSWILMFIIIRLT